MLLVMMATFGKMRSRLNHANIMKLFLMRMECASEPIQVKRLLKEHAKRDLMSLKTLNLTGPPSLSSMFFVRMRDSLEV